MDACLSDLFGDSFNTASGRYYCNLKIFFVTVLIIYTVSIPQAVGTIAIEVTPRFKGAADVSIPQAVGTIAIILLINIHRSNSVFQYRKR